MKKILSLTVFSTILVGLGGCTSVSSPPTTKIQVVTTFLPITQFTKAVVGDRAQVTQLLPPNVGPHDYQAKPEDAQLLAKADVLVKNGLEIEDFLSDLVKNAENSKLQTIDTSKGIQPITTESVKEHQDPGHQDPGDNVAEHAHTKHQHGEYNPHIWLDPKRAIRQVENIRDGLIAADPAGKAIYNANALAYIKKLQTLDREIAATLAPYHGKTFVAYHDFAPYFAQSYNLKVKFLVDVPEDNPSPEDVKRVVRTVKDSNLKTLLTEPQVGEGSFTALAADLKVKVSLFDSLETGNTATGTDYYLETLQKNLRNLKTALGS